MSRINAKRWFLPEMPDVLGTLREQAATTVEGIDAFVAWAEGDEAAADTVRACEHRADDYKRELRQALTTAFSTPLEPEDIFELSRGIDEIINSAKNVVREAEVMGTTSDPPIAEMAREIRDGTTELAGAFAALDGDGVEDSTAAADRAVKAQRRVEHIYRAAMSGLVDVEDVRDVTARRELYRRLARTSDRLVDVAQRVWYAVLKQT